MPKVMQSRIQHKHDLEVNWLKATFVPLKGELIIYDAENDTDAIPEGRTTRYSYSRFKIGDGVKTVNELQFTLDNYATIDSIPNTDNFASKTELETLQNSLDNLIGCGTTDPAVTTTSKFYFKYSAN
jgi:hypothetical protein